MRRSCKAPPPSKSPKFVHTTPKAGNRPAMSCTSVPVKSRRTRQQSRAPDTCRSSRKPVGSAALKIALSPLPLMNKIRTTNKATDKNEGSKTKNCTSKGVTSKSKRMSALAATDLILTGSASDESDVETSDEEYSITRKDEEVKASDNSEPSDKDQTSEEEEEEDYEETTVVNKPTKKQNKKKIELSLSKRRRNTSAAKKVDRYESARSRQVHDTGTVRGRVRVDACMQQA